MNASLQVRRARRIGAAARGARALIRLYQLTLSSLIGRHCRHLPTCSSYTDEAIARHGAWAGGWIGMARICRCHPLGTSGLDFVPPALPVDAAWYRPWAYGRWRGTNTTLDCEAVGEGAGEGSAEGRADQALSSPSRENASTAASKA